MSELFSELQNTHPLTIRKKVQHKLSSCLSAYSKPQLEILIEEMGISSELPKSAKKAEIVSILHDEILKRTEYMFRFFSAPVFTIIGMLALDTQESYTTAFEALQKKLGDDFDAYAEEATGMATINGFLFLFEDPDINEQVIIVPDEIKDIFYDLMQKTHDGKFYPGDLLDFLNYAETLSSLYGICPVELFIEIYNRDFPKNGIGKKNDFITLLNQAATASNYFFYQDEKIFDSRLEEVSIAHLLKDREHFKPYIPAKEELQKHLTLADYDEELPAVRQMASFLAKQTKEKELAEYATAFILPYIKLRAPLKIIFELLQNETGITFTKKSIQAFAERYTELTNTCHMWSNWGHPPATVYAENGSYDNIKILNKDR